jgi:hypothetical protein
MACCVADMLRYLAVVEGRWVGVYLHSIQRSSRTTDEAGHHSIVVVAPPRGNCPGCQSPIYWLLSEPKLLPEPWLLSEP